MLQSFLCGCSVNMCCCRQPESLLASVLAHPVLTASGLQGRDHRFIPPSSAASAAASVLASLSHSQLAQPSRGHLQSVLPSSIHSESAMYRSDRTVIDRYYTLYSLILHYIRINRSYYPICLINTLFSVWLTVHLTSGAMHCTLSLPQPK